MSDTLTDEMLELIPATSKAKSLPGIIFVFPDDRGYRRAISHAPHDSPWTGQLSKLLNVGHGRNMDVFGHSTKINAGSIDTGW